ncbi:hypothetical protein [Neisseria sicca]|uniref:hypothetical protein n=1 Tax=Neisseria sicca TaxID=490 RepID=UPI003F9FE9AF
MGFTHESNSKFQTTSFTQHYRGQSTRYNVHRWGKGRLKTEGAIFAETSAFIPAQAGIQILAFGEYFKAAAFLTYGFLPYFPCVDSNGSNGGSKAGV